MKKLAAEKVKGQTMGLLCRLFGKSWQAYYQYRDTLGKQRLKEEMVVQFIKDVRHIMRLTQLRNLITNHSETAAILCT